MSEVIKHIPYPVAPNISDGNGVRDFVLSTSEISIQVYAMVAFEKRGVERPDSPAEWALSFVGDDERRRAMDLLGSEREHLEEVLQQRIDLLLHVWGNADHRAHEGLRALMTDSVYGLRGDQAEVHRKRLDDAGKNDGCLSDARRYMRICVGTIHHLMQMNGSVVGRS